jgi:hypothetical protein
MRTHQGVKSSGIGTERSKIHSGAEALSPCAGNDGGARALVRRCRVDRVR